MSELHVVRVFVDPDGRGGNPLGVFVDGATIHRSARQGIAADLGFSETVFVDDVSAEAATIAIFTPTSELRFAGHPTVGTSWLLRLLGCPVGVLRVLAGDATTWADDELTWIRARADWSPRFTFRQYRDAAEVDALEPPTLGEPGIYAWAWEDEAGGRIRARSFPTDYGIREDEATGAAAVVLGNDHRRSLTIRQGAGSEIRVEPGPDDWVDVGGRSALVERRTHP